MIVPKGGFLLPSNRVPRVCPGGGGGGGMVLDEIDTCINLQLKVSVILAGQPSSCQSLVRTNFMSITVHDLKVTIPFN